MFFELPATYFEFSVQFYFGDYGGEYALIFQLEFLLV